MFLSFLLILCIRIVGVTMKGRRGTESKGFKSIFHFSVEIVSYSRTPVIELHRVPVPPCSKFRLDIANVFCRGTTDVKFHGRHELREFGRPDAGYPTADGGFKCRTVAKVSGHGSISFYDEWVLAHARAQL
jgi:hypothetical protein